MKVRYTAVIPTIRLQATTAGITSATLAEHIIYHILAGGSNHPLLILGIFGSDLEDLSLVSPFNYKCNNRVAEASYSHAFILMLCYALISSH